MGLHPSDALSHVSLLVQFQCLKNAVSVTGNYENSHERKHRIFLAQKPLRCLTMTFLSFTPPLFLLAYSLNLRTKSRLHRLVDFIKTRN